MSTVGARVLTGSFLAVVGLFTLKLLAALFSGLMALLGFVLFTVIPVVFIGWLLFKAVKYLKSDRPAFE